MAYAELEGFRESIRDLYQKGGPFRNAADKVLSTWAKAHQGMSVEAAFSGVALTHSGEGRIPHSRKYELPGRARLIVALHENICMFLFAGDHDAVDGWATRNRGIDFIANGSIQIAFGYVVSAPALATEQVRHRYYERFAEAIGPLSTPYKENGFPSFPADRLNDEAKRKSGLGVAQAFSAACKGGQPIQSRRKESGGR